MKKYHVAIILLRKRLTFVYQLEAMFGKYMKFTSYFIEEGINSYINCDLAIVPSYEAAELAQKYLLPQTPLLVIRRTLSQEAFKKVLAIPPHTRVLVVNTYWQMTIQTISSLYELGVAHLDLIPYSNDSNDAYENIDYAISANEPQYVPKHISHIIDIGFRLVDISSLFDILNKLNLLNAETRKILREHEQDMVPLSSGFVSMFNHFQQKNENFDMLLDMLDDGVLMFDADFRIKIYNKRIVKFFSSKLPILTDYPVNKIFDSHVNAILSHNKIIRDEMFMFGNKYYLLNRQNAYDGKTFTGGFITIRECESIESQNFTISRAITNKGYQAKYNFESIQGKNRHLLKTIAVAKKAAATDSDILVEGESGTGKELLVQSIHNVSKRSSGPFVTFNCAALTGSLIESELFGYEQGSFTGASCYGKHGLFEIADHGTIFLDEISEIPLDIQVKLLRVLQEREFIRVGGTQTIPIDVRIIVATNQNLYELVQTKKFRMDLYFRLNVFNIKVPALRERRDDIPYLVHYFLKQKDIKIDFPYDVMEFFQNYDWPGNIRELKNCIEYMVNIDEGFCKENLPQYMKHRLQQNKNDAREQTIDANIDISEETLLLLRLIADAHKKHIYIGRRELARKMTEQNIFISEQSIRTMLYKLSNLGLVHLSRGRAGTRVTIKGLEYINCVNKKG